MILDFLKKLFGIGNQAKTEDKKRSAAGRKAKPAEEKAQKKLISLRPEDWQKIDGLARKMDTHTRSAVIRTAIEELEKKINNS